MDYFFWFVQPSTILSSADKMFALIFAVLLGLAIISRVTLIFVHNQLNRKLLAKVWHLTFWIGLSGLIWFAMRYESVFIFGRRYWAGLVLSIGIIWLLFILKYAIFNYPKQKVEYKRELIKSKYLPASTRRESRRA